MELQRLAQRLCTLRDHNHRSCHDEQWLQRLLDDVQNAKHNATEAQERLKTKHGKWQAEIADCRIERRAAQAAFDSACQVWLQRMDHLRDKLPHSAAGTSLQIEASCSYLPDWVARLAVGRRWKQGTVDQLENLNQVHLSTRPLTTAAPQGSSMPRY